MRVLAKCKIRVGDVVIEPGGLVEISDSVRTDHYFELCLQCGRVQIAKPAKTVAAKPKKKAKAKKEE